MGIEPFFPDCKGMLVLVFVSSFEDPSPLRNAVGNCGLHPVGMLMVMFLPPEVREERVE